jgi:DNA-binding beta-propeller fold protein YncE
MAITPDGKKVYVANAGTGTETFELIPSNSVSIVDTETKEVKTIEIGNFPTYMVMTPDGKKSMLPTAVPVPRQVILSR